MCSAEIGKRYEKAKCTVGIAKIGRVCLGNTYEIINFLTCKVLKMNNSKKMAFRFISICSACFLLPLANSWAVTTKVFSGTTANSIQNGFDYFNDGEGAFGGIVDTVSLASQPASENLGTPGVVIFEFLAPTGKSFQLDASKYSGSVQLSMYNYLYGISSAPMSVGGVVSLIGATGNITFGSATTGLNENSFNNRLAFDINNYNVSGFGTFTGIRFEISTSSSFSDSSVTWSGALAGGAPSMTQPTFTARADTSVNNGPVLTLVPEPSALSLLAVGLGGLAMIRRRRS